ncbi:hypothetical protein M3182_17700 [Mesobacillus maritimus]|uniref:hypothetical protein n=1 Tax=Mesobacillus maritimus TaxID=1643336 RepID=UPI002040271E|nr:hypothetical protein [Mesobacillus maritimus]MCM3587574.1 hypothetical protein [Mesobacillus maritimus]MCM3671998.1 hypothetical protein [Mesobacillus maritimus]
MDKEKIYQHVESMITSSTKNPKYMSVSPVKMADLYGADPAEIEKNINELVQEGRLVKTNLPEIPNYEVYMLP